MGIDPLYRITAGLSLSKYRVPLFISVTWYMTLPAIGSCGMLATSSFPILIIGAVIQVSLLLIRINRYSPLTEVSGTVIDTLASSLPSYVLISLYLITW